MDFTYFGLIDGKTSIDASLVFYDSLVVIGYVVYGHGSRFLVSQDP